MPVQQNPALSLKAKLFRGLSDPSRLAIVEALRFGARTVSEIVSVTSLSQPNVSAHLACLKDCGLVASKQEGRHVFYALGDPRLESLFQAAEGILSTTAQRISGCSNYGCHAANRCVSDKECASPARVELPYPTRQGLKIPLAEGATVGGKTR